MILWAPPGDVVREQYRFHVVAWFIVGVCIGYVCAQIIG